MYGQAVYERMERDQAVARVERRLDAIMRWIDRQENAGDIKAALKAKVRVETLGSGLASLRQQQGTALANALAHEQQMRGQPSVAHGLLGNLFGI